MLREVQETVYYRQLNLRSLERIICDSRFVSHFEEADDEVRKEIIDNIKGCMNAATTYDSTRCLDWVKRWYRHETCLDTSIHALRYKAKELGIERYSRLDKQSLLLEIRRRSNEIQESRIDFRRTRTKDQENISTDRLDSAVLGGSWDSELKHRVQGRETKEHVPSELGLSNSLADDISSSLLSSVDQSKEART